MLLKVLSALWLSYFPHEGAIYSLGTPKMVQTAILQASSTHGLGDQLKARVLSRQIIRTADCFDLDPMIFTALIWRESHFKQKSQSETGAVGLTQLTTTGIHEVLDRLAAHSPRRRESFRMQLAACYPHIFRTIPQTTEFVDFSEWKRSVAQSPELALVFGAILLKNNLKKDDMRMALEKYNGDPRVKVRFASDVLTLAGWISSSFTVIPQPGPNSSKFLASIQVP